MSGTGNIDPVLRVLGKRARYQMLQLIVINVGSFGAAYQLLDNIFIGEGLLLALLVLRARVRARVCTCLCVFVCVCVCVLNWQICGKTCKTSACKKQLWLFRFQAHGI